MNAPRPALVYSEVGVRLLEIDERDKAYELFVLAGNLALGKVLDNPAPPITKLLEPSQHRHERE